MPSFDSASPYQDDILGLPVTDLDATSKWYCRHFAMTEISRSTHPPTVILQRDKVRLGFAINGGDPSAAGAAIAVRQIEQLKSELESTGITISNPRVDQRDGIAYNVFFVVAPDGLCYYFHEPAGA